MRHRQFTLIEILIVMVVIGLVLAIAAPRLARRSQRMTVEKALTAIRSAVNDTAMRARATGQALTLTLNTEENELVVGTMEESLDRGWTPPQHETSGDEDTPKASFIQAKPSYTLPKDIEWTPEDNNFNDDGAIVFSFFPDGQAAAREIAFVVCEKNFLLQIDRITADPVILEVLE